MAGDFVVDVMTGTALGFWWLRVLWASAVFCHVPSRYEDGYGMSEHTIKIAAENKVTLLITVDNGIGSVEAVAGAGKLGIDVVITDHHEAPEVLPEAVAIVDPKQNGCAFPSKNLCGVGVLFYVLIAVRARLIEKGVYPDLRSAPSMSQFLDLVSVGSSGDVVPRDANNRRMVNAGIRRMRAGCINYGLRALAEVARVDLVHLTATNVAFDLCPRLNAAGRLQLPDNPALDCLMAADPLQAGALALKLDLCNRRRGDFERVMLADAQTDAANFSGRRSLVLFNPAWLQGISGLIANRLKDEYQIPCFVFAGAGEEIVGSARSVPGFPLAAALQKLNDRDPGVMVRFGGHAMAAGASIHRDKLERFRELFDEIAADEISGVPAEIEIETDGPLPPECMNVGFARALEALGPFGQGFAEPRFDGVFMVDNVSSFSSGRHLRLRLSCNGSSFSAVRFKATESEQALRVGMMVHAVYTMGVDRYNNQERLQVKIENIGRV